MAPKKLWYREGNTQGKSGGMRLIMMTSTMLMPSLGVLNPTNFLWLLHTTESHTNRMRWMNTMDFRGWKPKLISSSSRMNSVQVQQTVDFHGLHVWVQIFDVFHGQTSHADNTAQGRSIRRSLSDGRQGGSCLIWRSFVAMCVIFSVSQMIWFTLFSVKMNLGW